ncbi:hypothetical protein POTOM_015694 [Populus tomentosa]|uniref:Uncharacterized protein n=1 Tax=Populus tomentosa TaxID=118781 RepID=A0A8X8A2C2_POPTO|nr:hypothetical protein POTOM_015694 [Populus tomentosa]
MKQEFNKAESRAKHAISSVRTIYAFVGESKASSAYSAALQLPVKLGLRQGLAMGLVVSNNGVVFAVWSFTSYYGSRMLIVSFVIIMKGEKILGPLHLFAKATCFADACSTGERIMEVMIQVPKIDLDNMEGEILDNVRVKLNLDKSNFRIRQGQKALSLKIFVYKSQQEKAWL